MSYPIRIPGPPERFEVALWAFQIDAYNVAVPNPTSEFKRTVAPAGLTRILRTIAAFECLQRELDPYPDRLDWIYHWQRSFAAVALFANDEATIADWFRQIGSFAPVE